MKSKDITYKPYSKNGVEYSGEERKRKVQKLMASMMFNYLENINKQNT